MATSSSSVVLETISDSDLALSNLPATLLAMAGHDLRQPLQVITSAHDILAQIIHNDAQLEELARAEDATTQLAGMLGQLVEALRLHEQSTDQVHAPVRLHPILADLTAEFASRHGGKGSRFASHRRAVRLAVTRFC
jgi:signal transduction histidine kinase